MMVKLQSKLYRSLLLLSSLSLGSTWVSCTVPQTKALQSQQNTETTPAVGSLVVREDKKGDFGVEVSPSDVKAGSLLWVQLKPFAHSEKIEVKGEFEGFEFPFFSYTEGTETVYAAVLGIPYETKVGSAKLKVTVLSQVAKMTREAVFQVVDGKYPSEVLHVDSRRVTPTRKSDLLRIQKEQAEVAAIYTHCTPEKFWNGPFVMPIQSAVTSAFGTKRLYNGKLKNFHPGLDLRAPTGTPIYSAAPGRVVLAKNLFYTGNTVMIDHGFGVVTLYAHLSKIQVTQNQIVKSQELVGLSGKTGRVNGPHLHWQAIIHRTKVNPMGLVQFLK